jgi:hypothetical protein
MAVALAPQQIRVNGVSVGSVLSNNLLGWMRDHEHARSAILDATPMGRLANAAEVGDTVQYLASDASSFVTGQIVTLDGGRTLVDPAAIAVHWALFRIQQAALVCRGASLLFQNRLPREQLIERSAFHIHIDRLRHIDRLHPRCRTKRGRHVAVAVTLAAHIKAPADALLLVNGKAAIQISLRLRNQKGVHTQRL